MYPDSFDSVFYDAAANWQKLNPAPPCDTANGITWAQQDQYAQTIVAPFINSLKFGNGSPAPIFFNENGETDTSPQADGAVRGMFNYAQQQSGTGAGVIGFRVEQCYEAFPVPSAPPVPSSGGFWSSVADDEILPGNEGWYFGCQYGSGLTGDVSDSLNLRMFVAASLLVTYADNAGSWGLFNTTDGFKVMPESGIVPTLPVQALPTPGPDGGGDPSKNMSHDGGKSFYRQYGECYLREVPEGPCVVFVTMKDPVPWPSSFASQYPRTVHLTGADILLGGTITIISSPQPSTIPAHTGVIAFGIR